jgi:hypothetical protein
MLRLLDQNLLCLVLGLEPRIENFTYAQPRPIHDDYRFEHYEIIDGQLYHGTSWFTLRVPLKARPVAVTDLNMNNVKVILEDGSEWVLFPLYEDKVPEPVELRVRLSIGDYFKSTDFIIREYLRERSGEEALPIHM